MKRILLITFLFFIAFFNNSYAETISTATTDESTKTITEDLTITSTGSRTCVSRSTCVKVNAEGLTITNRGTLDNTGDDTDIAIKAVGGDSADDVKIYNYGTMSVTGNSTLFITNLEDSNSDGVGGYVYNSGTMTAGRTYTIRYHGSNLIKIDNYGTITNTHSNGQTLFGYGETNTTINNYSSGTISAPNGKWAIHTNTTSGADLGTNTTINNWGTITAPKEPVNLGSSSTINNYGSIISENTNKYSIVNKGNNNTVNLYDGTILVGYLDADSNSTTGSTLNLDLCSSYYFKATGTWTVNDISGCGDVAYSGNFVRSSSALSQSTADENAALRVDHINEAFDYSNKKRNKNKEFGFFSKSYSDRDNGNAIDKFASLKNNAVIGFPLDNEKYSGHQIFSFSSDNLDFLNLNVLSSSLQSGFIFEDLNFFTDKKIGLKSVFGYHKYKSNRTQLNNQKASGKETIIKDYNSFSAIVGSQIQIGNIEINLDTSFERFPNYIESDDVTWNSRLVGQFMADITYDLKKNLNKNFSFNPEVGFGGRTLFLGKNQKYTVGGQDLTFNGGVQEDAFAKFALNVNYSFLDNTSLFIKTSAKKTTENQETYGLNFGFKSVF